MNGLVLAAIAIGTAIAGVWLLALLAIATAASAAAADDELPELDSRGEPPRWARRR